LSVPNGKSSSMKRLGIDTGGTFTDVVSDSGEILKVPSTPSDPSEAIIAAVHRVVGLESPIHLIHGTTVATNTVLEGKWAPIGLLVNRGFRDLLTIGRQARPKLYELEPKRYPIPVQPSLVREVGGRITADGSEIEAFDEASCVHAVAELKALGVTAIAVLFLHSYRNDEHERKAQSLVLGAGLPCTRSSELNPEFREVERGFAAATNAALQRPVGTYLQRLRQGLHPATRLHVMSSDAGVLSFDEACKVPARLLLSGPAGGLVACQRYAQALGLRQVLTLDMGGTSTDVALLDGTLPLRPSLTVAGLPMRLPSLDLHTVGAGGGSLIERDAGGAVCVGPRSAGADPGPAAYGTGSGLTLTDAHLLLGHLDPAGFAGGARPLDTSAALRIANSLAKDVGMSVSDLLRGSLRIADAVMTRALRAISLERGIDPRGLSLLVFGGAGGLHGVALARSLGMGLVVVPGMAGVLSAQGLLWAAPSRSAARTVLLSHIPDALTRRHMAAPLIEDLRSRFLQDGAKESELSSHVSYDLRYSGQSFELALEERGENLAMNFHAAHQRRFGFAYPDARVELTTVRVRVEGPAPEIAFPSPTSPREKSPGVSMLRGVCDGTSLSLLRRAELSVGERISGPAIVVDATSTVLLDERSCATVHPTGCLLIEVKP
jgi:N-methylhydantoinase A